MPKIVAPSAKRLPNINAQISTRTPISTSKENNTTYLKTDESIRVLERDCKLDHDVDSGQISIAITSYNRPRELINLLKDIRKEMADKNIHVTVYDDESTESYSAVRNYLSALKWSYVRVAHCGKPGYIKLMSFIFNDSKQSQAKYYYFMQDDVCLCADFFDRTIRLWEEIEDQRKATLFLFVDASRGANGIAPWTGERIVRMRHISRTQWVDGVAFMFGSLLLAEVAQGIPSPPASWFHNPINSSGFGGQLSNMLNKRGYSLYQVNNSHVFHRQIESKMNKLARRSAPLPTLRFIGQEGADKKVAASLAQNTGAHVTIGIASIPARAAMLKEVVRQLLPQADTIGVYLNGYSEVPKFLLDSSKILVARSQDYGDRGDAGKFFWVNKAQEYYFTCDDDLDYPNNYVQTLINTSRRYGNRVVVGVHGALLKNPFESYYKSRVGFHFTRELKKDTQVHVLGTGTSAFHVSALKISPEDFKKPNMADVWLAILGQEQSVSFICVARPKEWLRDRGARDTIHSNSIRHTKTKMDSGSIQTEEVKRRMPWKLFTSGTKE